MIYRQFLVMRKAVAWFIAALLVFWIWFAVNNLFLHGNDRFSATLDFSMVTTMAWPLAIFAAVFGAAFSAPSREPARYLWTLPKPRWRTGIEAIGTDLIALLIAYVALILVIYAPEIPVIGAKPIAAMLEHVTLPYALLGIALPFAIYGYSAATAMCFRRAPFIGVATVPIFLLWLVFADDPADGFMRTLGVVNPFMVFTQAAQVPGLHLSFGSRVADAMHWITPSIGIAVLFGIGIACCGFAAIMWSRSELVA